VTDEDDYRKRAEALLKAAAETDNMKQRGQLIDQAMHWHNLAMEAHQLRDEPAANDADDDDLEARA
jgi:hypothetical protein